MHPIERLRHVARARGVPQEILLHETATAMMSFADDPAALLTACRRMVSRQPESGAQVTLAARLLTAPNPRQAAWEAVEELEQDTTARSISNALDQDATVCVIGWPDLVGPHLARRGDVEVLVVHVDSNSWGMAERFMEDDVVAIDVDPGGLGSAVRASNVTVLEAVAAGPASVLTRRGGLAAAAVAQACGRGVWLATPAGTVLPEKMWSGLMGRYEQLGDTWDLDFEEVPLELVTTVYGPCGALAVADILRHSSCPIAPELFESGA